MSWAQKEAVRVVIPVETLEFKETLWLPSPVSERETWEKNFRECDYVVDGEYEIDGDLTLLRFRFYGSSEDLFKFQIRRYHNVILSKSMPPFKPADMTYGKRK